MVLSTKVEQARIERAKNMHLDWPCVTVLRYKHISPEWCKNNIHDTYRCYGYFWYFKDPADAMMFALTWG